MYNVVEMDDAARLAGAHTLLRDTMLFLMPEEGEYVSILLHGFTAIRRNRIWQGLRMAKHGGPSIGLVVQGNKFVKENGAIQVRCRQLLR